MGNPHDADEVVQDAFVSAYKARDRFRCDDPANNLAVSHHSKCSANAHSQRQNRQRDYRILRPPDIASSSWA